MDLINSQESEIMNEGDLSYIMNDLGSSQPYMFLQGNEYVDIYNPSHQQQHLLQQHQIKNEHQLQQHQEQQHLNDNNLLQGQQHLADNHHLQDQQHLADNHHLPDQQHLNALQDQQHLTDDQHLQQHQMNDNHHLQQQQQQQHLNGNLQMQEQPQHFENENHHPMMQPATNGDSDAALQVRGAGGEMLPPPAPTPPPPPAQQQQQQQHTSPTGLQPCLTTYPGVYDFQVNLANTHNGRHAWVYSSKLQKIYIDIDKVLLLQFKLNTVDVKGLCVRALLVYSDPDNAMLAVNRCTLHMFKCDPNRLAHADASVCKCASFKQCGHVVTSDHPLARHEWNAASGRHSVLVPLSGGYVAGQDAAATVAYLFGCKTSCAAGMSRRPVQLVFTLENQFGDVLGRSTAPVKICSCPKRDKDREESGETSEWRHTDANGSAATTKYPLLQPPQPPHTKKRKLQHQHINSSTSKMARAADPLSEDANQLPGIAMLFEEVHKLNVKLDQLNAANQVICSNCRKKFSPLSEKLLLDSEITAMTTDLNISD